MKNSAFWKPVVIGFLATPICLFISIIATGGGHSYWVAKVMFPYAMQWAIFSESSNIALNMVTVILPAVNQFPLYGLIYGVVKAKDKYRRLPVVILIMHILAATICLLFNVSLPN